MGLYARVEGPTPGLLLEPYCASVVDIVPGKKAYQPPIVSPPAVARVMPLVEETPSTSSFGCPCYSSLLFNEVGQVRSPMVRSPMVRPSFRALQ